MRPSNEPSLNVVKRLAQALRVSADAQEEREAIRSMLDAMIVKNQVASALEGVATATRR